jgi:hypothetical protein
VLVWTKRVLAALPSQHHEHDDRHERPAFAPADARSIVMNSVADYVLVCPAEPETRYYARHAANGAAPEATLSAMLAEGRHPDWLAPVDLAESPLKLYRVIR